MDKGDIFTPLFFGTDMMHLLLVYMDTLYCIENCNNRKYLNFTSNIYVKILFPFFNINWSVFAQHFLPDAQNPYGCFLIDNFTMIHT